MHALVGFVWKANPWTRKYRQEYQEPTERPVGWLSGSCLLLRRKAFDAIGGFDERFFMYMDDVDLGDRLGKAGWLNVYVPTAEILHDKGHSTGRDPARNLQAHHESAYIYLADRHKAGGRPVEVDHEGRADSSGTRGGAKVPPRTYERDAVTQANATQTEGSAVDPAKVDAVILVGGKGTRLRPLTIATAKPMLPTAGVPFLTHMLSRIAEAGIKHVVLGTSYRAETFESEFGDGSKLGLEIEYVTEPEPWGRVAALPTWPRSCATTR